MTSTYFFGYALGTVLAGFGFVLIPWLLSVLWNRLLPGRAGNPWTLPLITIVICSALAFIAPTDPTEGDAQYRPVIVLGLSPAVLLCLFRRRAYSRKSSEASVGL